ncbi:MAG: hypothetical protein U1F35_16640 [Steroidobacteraceae bacterium]
MRERTRDQINAERKDALVAAHFLGRASCMASHKVSSRIKHHAINNV